MSCPALVRKLVFVFYKRVKASQNYIVQAISHTSCHVYVAFAFFYYATTYNYVIWTEGVSEINY